MSCTEVTLLLSSRMLVATTAMDATGPLGMVVGAFSGPGVWRLPEPFAPGVGHSPGPVRVGRPAPSACWRRHGGCEHRPVHIRAKR
jgi:hypothetical protein